jgi:hypothetical protein
MGDIILLSVSPEALISQNSIFKAALRPILQKKVCV